MEVVPKVFADILLHKIYLTDKHRLAYGNKFL